MNHQRLFDPSFSLDLKMEVLLLRNFATTNVQAHQLAFWILWRLWKNRNQLVFQHRHQRWSTNLALASNDAQKWLSAHEYISLNRQ